MIQQSVTRTPFCFLSPPRDISLHSFLGSLAFLLWSCPEKKNILTFILIYKKTAFLKECQNISLLIHIIPLKSVKISCLNSPVASKSLFRPTASAFYFEITAMIIMCSAQGAHKSIPSKLKMRFLASKICVHVTALMMMWRQLAMLL